MFKFLRSKKGQGMVEYGLIICAVAIAAVVGLNALGNNNSDRTMEIAETLEEANSSFDAEKKDAANKESIKNYNSGNGGHYSGGGGGGSLGAFPSYSGSGINRKPTYNADGTENTNDRIGTVDEEATEDAPLLNDDAPEGNQAPVASFYVVNADRLKVGNTVTVYNTSSDPDGDAIVKEEWSGLPSGGDSFTIEGEYTIRLRVVDEWGNWSQWVSQTIKITNSKPVAVITANPDFTDGQEFDKTQIFQWSSSSSYDPDGHRIVDQEWEGKQNNYAAGEHTVKLRVKDEYGSWSEWTSKTFNIFDGSRPVIISGTVADAKNNEWSIDIISQTEEQIPKLVNMKNIFFKTDLSVTDEDRDGITAIQYRIDGNLQNTLYNITSSGTGEEKTVSSPTSTGVPYANMLSVGRHAIEMRVRDDSGAWSEWSSTFYLEVLNVKEETGEEGEEQPETPEYITMEVYSYNSSSQSAVGGNRGPWYAGDFIIIPEDKTGTELKDAVLEIDGQEIESTFTTLAGQSVILFNYTTTGMHTLRAKFLDENDVWSDYVVKNDFSIQEINIYFSFSGELNCDMDCIYLELSTANTGINTDFPTTLDTIYEPYYTYFSYSNATGAQLASINVKIDDVIVKTVNLNEMESTWTNEEYLYGESWNTSFFASPLTMNENHTISMQAVDTNGVASKWTNTVIFKKPEISEDSILPDPAAIIEISAPYTTSTYDGWTQIIYDEDDYSEHISLPSGKTITFGNNTYNSLYVSSNLIIGFEPLYDTDYSTTIGSSNANNAIFLLNRADTRANVFFKHTETGIDILFEYSYYDSSLSANKSKAIAHINFDGTGSLYFVGSQDSNGGLHNRYGDLNTAIQTTTTSTSTILNSLGSNYVLSWTATGNNSPYYALSNNTSATIPNEYIEMHSTRHYEAVFINGTKITTPLTLLTDNTVPFTHYVHKIQGTINFKNTTTNEILSGTFIADGIDYDVYDLSKNFSISVNEIPGLIAGTYEMSIDNPFVAESYTASKVGYRITNNSEPIIIELRTQDTTISNLSLAENDEYTYINVTTNNYGSTKDQAELIIDDVTYTQVYTIEEAKNTENSFYIEPSTASIVTLRLYNSSFEPGVQHNVKTKIHIANSTVWSNLFEKNISIPALSVSSVSVNTSPSTSKTTLTVYLNNYTGKEPIGVKVKVDDVISTEDTSFTTFPSANYFTKAIDILEPGSHTIKITVTYKTISGETVYEAAEYTKSYTQSEYTPTISSLAEYSTSGDYYIYKVNYSNPYNVSMLNKTYVVSVNDIDISSQITTDYTSSSYDRIKIPISTFTSGTNTIKVKVKYKTSSNAFAETLVTNEKSITRTLTAPSVSSISVSTSQADDTNNYLTVNYSNSRKVGINSLLIYVDNTLTTSEITSTTSSISSSTVKIDKLSLGSHVIKAVVTFADGTVSEYSTTHTLAAPLPYSTTITHNNKTSNAKEYLTVQIYTPETYTFKNSDFEIKFNDETVDIVDSVSTSYSSGSYSTTNGTMKYRYTVNIYLNDYLYREGTNTIDVIANIMGTEMTFNTLTENNAAKVGYPYSYPKVDNKTDPTKLTLQNYIYSGTYFRVASLLVKEYSDSARTNLISEYTLANTNQYKYVGGSYTTFESMPISNPTDTHYYTLTYVTPWGTTSDTKNFTYANKDDYMYSATLTYVNDDAFSMSTCVYIFDAVISPTNFEIKFDSSETVYTSTTYLSSNTYLSGGIPTSAYCANSFGNQIVNPQTISSGSTSDSSTMKYRIKYNDGTYSNWLNYTVTFNYPKLSSISALTNEDKIVNGIPALKITLNASQLSANETFTPEVILDGETIPVIASERYSTSTYYIWIEQPESGIYNNLSVKLGYNNRYTNTVSKKDIAITKAGEELMYDVIPVTRTTNVSMPTFNISEYTKLSSNPANNDGLKISLSTPLNFLGTSVNSVFINAGTIAFSNTNMVPTPVLNNLSNTSKLNESLTGLDNNAVSIYPNSYQLKYASEKENSGVYYKDTTDKLFILYNNLKGEYFKTSENTYPYFTILVEINKSTGAGNVYYADMNPTNNAAINTVYTTTSTGKCPRTLVVKKSSTEYGYVKAWYTDAATQNPDTIYSNTKFSWSSDFYQELPPVINNITYAKTSQTTIDVTINYTSRSVSNNVQTAKLTTASNTLSTTFEQIDNDTIIMRNITIPTTANTTMYGQIVIDNLTSTLKPFMLLTAPNITAVNIQSDQEKEMTFDFTVENPTNAQIIDIFPVIKSRTTSETITTEFKNKTITSNSISFKTDLLPQDFYYLTIYATYQDIGDIGHTNTFTHNFTTTVSNFDTTTDETITNTTYSMREITYPTDISFDTTGYTRFANNTDSYTQTVTLPIGKYINFAGTDYNKIYFATDSTISFTSSYSSHGPVYTNLPNASILPIGGKDLKTYGYYKITDTGIDIIYKYSHYSSSYTSDKYVKLSINASDGSGKIYYQGLGSGVTTSGLHSYVKVNNSDYTAIVANGSATTEKFTEKAYEWYKNTTSDFTTVTPEYSDSSKTYVMKEVSYPSNMSTSTSGYTTLFSSTDDTSMAVNLPSGKYINFGGVNYDKLYVNSNGQIRFGSSSSKYGDNLSVTSSYTTNSIVLLGGYDLNSYAYYKHVEDGIEILYKFAHRSVSTSSYVNYMKVHIKFDGTGTIYFIGTPNSNSTSGYTFVRVLGSDYDAIIPAGQGTKAKYTNKAYSWQPPSTFNNIPTITNLSFDKTTLEGGKTAKLTITTTKPITNADIYIGSDLHSFTNLTKEADNIYSVNIPIPNNISGNSLSIKVRGNFYEIHSYWKSISVPYTQSPAPSIIGTTNLADTIKQDSIVDFTINYEKSTLNNDITNLKIELVTNTSTTTLTPNNWNVDTANTISVQGLSLNGISPSNVSLKLTITDQTGITSNAYIKPITISNNEAPVLVSVQNPQQKGLYDGMPGIPYRTNMVFTLNVTDIENDDIKYIYYRYKSNTDTSWSGSYSLSDTSSSVEFVDKNTINVSLYTPYNRTETREYEFSVKDSYNKSNTVISTVNIVENTAPVITEILELPDTTIGTRIDVSATYTDVDRETDAISEIYVYIDDELVTQYQNAYVSGNSIIIRNLLINKLGEYDISIMVKDKYGKLSNKLSTPIKVSNSDTPILYSYTIDEVILGKDILLKDIYFTPSQNSNEITAIRYMIDGVTPEPVIIDFEEPITTNNFSYTLQNTASNTPDNELKYIFVSIKDGSGTWSSAVMGTYKIGYAKPDDSYFNVYLDYIEGMNTVFSKTELLYDYGYGYNFDKVSSLEITINGETCTDAIVTYSATDYDFNFSVDFSNVNNLIDGESYRIGLNFKNSNGTIVYTYDYATLTYVDSSVSEQEESIFKLISNSTTPIKGQTNKTLYFYPVLYSNDYDILSDMYDYGNYYFETVASIDNVAREDFTLSIGTNWFDYNNSYHLSSQISTKTNIDSTLRIKLIIRDIDDPDYMVETNEIAIPIKTNENVANLETLNINSFNYFKNKNKTLTDNNILGGNIMFSFGYRDSSASTGISKLEIFVDEETESLEINNINGTFSSSTNYKYGTVTGEINYTEIGTHKFTFVITNNSGNSYSIEKEFNIVKDYTPSLTVSKIDGTIISNTENIPLTATDKSLVFTLNDSPLVAEYSNMYLEINNVKYALVNGSATVDFSTLNQGYYLIKLIASTPIGDLASTPVSVLDNGVTKLISNITSNDVTTLTFPNSLYVFGRNYNNLYVSGTGAFSTNSGSLCTNCSISIGQYGSNQTIVPAILYDDWYGPYGSEQINHIFYKTNTDNITLYIDAVDNAGARVYYSIAFYNRDNIKFTYYIIEGSTASVMSAGINNTSTSYVVTNQYGNIIRDNSSVLIDTYNMTAR